MMKANIKRLAGVLCLLSVAFIFIACDGFFSRTVSYTFDNQSGYTVYVTFGNEYQYKSGDEYIDSKTKELTVYSNSSKEVFFDSTSVDFSWTAGSENSNQHIYCVVAGNKATFKKR